MVALLQAVIIGDGERVGEPPEVRLVPLEDVNNAEVVRALASGELRRLIELGLTAPEIVIQITTGTAAMSVSLALAATVHRIEVQHFPKFPPARRRHAAREPPGGGAAARGPGAAADPDRRRDTDRARCRLEEVLR